MAIKLNFAPETIVNKFCLYLAVALVAVMLVVPIELRSQESVQLLRVSLDKSSTLHLNGVASIVTVGAPSIADVTVVSPKLILVLGRKVGETNLIILGSGGVQIAAYNIIVVPQVERHVTIHKSTDGVTTLSCNPRCAGVKNPGIDTEPGATGGAASAPAGGASGAPGAPSSPASNGQSAAADGGATPSQFDAGGTEPSGAEQ
jgi:hypothetical protein